MECAYADWDLMANQPVIYPFYSPPPIPPTFVVFFLIKKIECENSGSSNYTLFSLSIASRWSVRAGRKSDRWAAAQVTGGLLLPPYTEQLRTYELFPLFFFFEMSVP